MSSDKIYYFRSWSWGQKDYFWSVDILYYVWIKNTFKCLPLLKKIASTKTYYLQIVRESIIFCVVRSMNHRNLKLMWKYKCFQAKFFQDVIYIFRITDGQFKLLKTNNPYYQLPSCSPSPRSPPTLHYATCHVATLGGHAHNLERCVIAQLHYVSCKTEPVLNSGAGVSLVCTGNNRPPWYCYPGSIDLGMIGSKTTSRDQTFACTCARLVCSNHAPWVRGSLFNPCSCLRNWRSFSHW